MPRPAMLTLAQVCAELQISERTGARRVKDGSIPHKRFGKFIRVPAAWVDSMRGDSGTLLSTSPEEFHAEKTPASAGRPYKM